MDPQKILMVDDRPENLIALEAVLEGDDRELIKATSGEEALKLLIKHDFSLILLDVQMPGMDGFEVAELARANKKIQRVPIIFVTAISKEDYYKFRGYEVGAVDYLTKPIDPMIIQSKVTFFLDLDKQKRVLEEKIRQSREYIQAYQQSKNSQ
jgi:response regulator RpfG family c-di-GMP phosphodiesterase